MANLPPLYPTGITPSPNKLDDPMPSTAQTSEAPAAPETARSLFPGHPDGAFSGSPASDESITSAACTAQPGVAATTLPAAPIATSPIDTATAAASAALSAAATAAATAALSKLPKVIKWTEALDMSLLLIVNSLGAFKEIGHGQKGPAFAKVSEQCSNSSVFTPIKHLLTAKKCSDRFDRLVKDHRVRREQEKNKTGTDDEPVSEKTQILDDICDYVDDAKEQYQTTADKKRELLDSLVAAGQQIRQNAMVRGPRGKKRARDENERHGEKDARAAIVLEDSEGDDDDDDAGGNTPRTSGATPNGPASQQTPRGRVSARRGNEDDDELEMLLAADKREDKKLENEEVRLELQREGLRTQQDELALRKEQHELSRMEVEARIKLDAERAEEDKKSREEDRAERKAQAQQNAKILDVVMNLLSKEKK